MLVSTRISNINSLKKKKLIMSDVKKVIFHYIFIIKN
jgi:hypothetical protein